MRHRLPDRPTRGQSEGTLAAEVFRAIHAKVASEPAAAGREVAVRVHPELQSYLDGEGRSELQKLEAALDIRVVVQGAPNQPRDEFEVRLR